MGQGPVLTATRRRDPTIRGGLHRAFRRAKDDYAKACNPWPGRRDQAQIGAMPGRGAVGQPPAEHRGRARPRWRRLLVGGPGQRWSHRCRRGDNGHPVPNRLDLEDLRGRIGDATARRRGTRAQRPRRRAPRRAGRPADHDRPAPIAHLGPASRNLWPLVERTPGVSFSELVSSSIRQADLLCRPGRRFHYSNTGYAVLGELIARKRSKAYGDVIYEELVEPCGMSRTTPRPVAPCAEGLAVHPHAGLSFTSPSTTPSLWRRPANFGRRSRTWPAGPTSSWDGARRSSPRPPWPR